MPLIDSSLYDCIVDTGERLLRVQIKSSSKTPENERRKNVHIPLQNNKRNYTKEKIDYFAVWCDFFDGWFIFKNNGAKNIKAVVPVKFKTDTPAF